jgi:putative chitinase
MISVNDLKKLVPNTPIKTLQEFADNFNKFAPKYGIDTLSRVSSFVGNSAIESFIKPIKEIGSKDYFIRMYWSNQKKAKELGNLSPEDAVKFSGKGYIQVTGRNNYKAISQSLFGDDRLLKNPEILLQPKYALLSAFEWWKMNGMNAVSDKYGIKGVASKINTGSPLKTPKALPERIKAYNTIFELLKKKRSLPNQQPIKQQTNKKNFNFFGFDFSWLFSNP